MFTIISVDKLIIKEFYKNSCGGDEELLR